MVKEPAVNITKDMLRLIAGIDEFKGAWQALGNLAPERLLALKKVATIESVGSSTRIEGVKLTDKEVGALLAGIDTRSFRSRDEQEVAGYAAAMNVIFDAFGDIPLTENHIKQLHGTLLRYSDKDIRHRGEYKKLPNHVQALDQNGNSLGVVFQTASPFDTPMKMKALVNWTGNTFEQKDLHPLLIIAVFVVHFLAIHPFQEGNGRLSRILTTLLLLQNGYDYVPYSSLESIVEQNKDRYYLALRKAQKTIDTDDAGLENWLVFFLTCMKKQKDRLSQKVEREHKMTGLSALSAQILQIVKEHGQARISDIQIITSANRNTIKVRLRELVENNYLLKHGKGKATRYTLGRRDRLTT
ncbi:MAG: Fic family protein [Desulfobacteraceae bacterium]|nr:Fic family protein [Desulfobacteraceae bacterium]